MAEDARTTRQPLSVSLGQRLGQCAASESCDVVAGMAELAPADDETALVLDTQRGDVEAFSELYRRHSPWVYVVARGSSATRGCGRF